jgi:hypothetical protein
VYPLHDQGCLQNRAGQEWMWDATASHGFALHFERGVSLNLQRTALGRTLAPGRLKPLIGSHFPNTEPELIPVIWRLKKLPHCPCKDIGSESWRNPGEEPVVSSPAEDLGTHACHLLLPGLSASWQPLGSQAKVAQNGAEFMNNESVV